MCSLLKSKNFKSLSFNTLETIGDNTSFPNQSLSALQARTSSSGWRPEFIPGYWSYPIRYLHILCVCILLRFIVYSSSLLPFCLITEQIPNALTYTGNEWILLITFYLRYYKWALHTWLSNTVEVNRCTLQTAAVWLFVKRRELLLDYWTNSLHAWYWRAEGAQSLVFTRNCPSPLFLLPLHPGL